MSGTGSLLGVVVGALAVNFLEQPLVLSLGSLGTLSIGGWWPDLDRSWRAIIACPILLAGIFLPRAVYELFRLAQWSVHKAFTGTKKPAPVLEKAKVMT
jgi:hypothetical protein